MLGKANRRAAGKDRHRDRELQANCATRWLMSNRAWSCDRFGWPRIRLFTHGNGVSDLDSILSSAKLSQNYRIRIELRPVKPYWPNDDREALNLETTPAVVAGRTTSPGLKGALKRCTVGKAQLVCQRRQ